MPSFLSKLPWIFLLALYAPLAARGEVLTISGADSSGGGKVVACRNADGSLKSVELLDLFEARALYGLAPVPEESSVDAYLTKVKAKLEVIYQNAFFLISPFHFVEQARSRMRLLPSGTELVNLDDAEEIALPTGCKTEQLAVYRENALLLINSDLWSALDPRNQAALLVHEAIYQLDRESGASNSIYARKVTGHLFSDFSFEPLLEGLPAKARICMVRSEKDRSRLPYYNFYLYEDEEQPGLAKLHFTAVDGKIPFSKTTANLGIVFHEGQASAFSPLRSKFETYSGISAGWESKAELLEGKFVVVIKSEGPIEAQCSSLEYVFPAGVFPRAP